MKKELRQMRGFEFVKDYKEKGLIPTIPQYQTKNAAGADFYAAEDVTIPSIWHLFAKNIYLSIFGKGGKLNVYKKQDKITDINPTLVRTGIKACMYEDEVLEIYDRSSNPKKLGLVIPNSVGIIDADYYGNPDNDGEIMFAFYNFKPFDVKIKAGDRIGQGLFKKVLRPEIGLSVKDSERAGGFGSTDKELV
jgi:dUTP pyrophosphatase